MLNTLLDNIRAVAGSRLVWLLEAQSDTLMSDATSAENEELLSVFFAPIERVFMEQTLPLKLNDNPLADVLLRNMPLVGLQVDKLSDTAGGSVFVQALNDIGALYVTLLPLRHDDHPLGVLLIADVDDTFVGSEQGQQFMKLIRRQTTIELVYLHHTETTIDSHQRALETQTKRLKTLNQASRAINSPIGLQDVIQVVLSLAYEVVGAEAAALLLRDDDDDLIVVATHNVSDMHGRAVTAGMGVIGWVADNRASALVPDVEQDPRYRSYVDSSAEIHTRAMLAVPLATTSDVIGVLVVMNGLEGEFSQDDLETLENLGASAATAIENATLFEQTQRRLTELSTMLDASAIATSTVELQSIVEPIARRLTLALNLQRVSVVLLQNDVMRRLVSVVNASWQPDKALSLPLARLPLKSKALDVPNTVALESSALSLEEQTELHLRGMRHAVNVPFMLHGETAGVIAIYGDTPFEHAAPTVILETIADWEANSAMPSEELSQLCQHILNASHASWCAIYLLNSTKDELMLVREMGAAYHKPNSGVAIEGKWFPTAIKVMSTGDILPTTVEMPESKQERNYLRLLGLTDVLFAPILRQGVGIGVVELGITDERPFDVSAVSLSRGIANIIGNAIESYRLYSSLEQRASALEAAYRELEDADRLKDELLQNMSHELGTPLTHILGYLSLLGDGAFGSLNREQQDTVDLAVRKTQHVANMIKQMVVIHASNATDLNLRDTHLDQLAALTVRSIEPRAHAAGITIKPRISRKLPKVRVDQVALSEVFNALLDNAIKFSGDGKLIEVEIRDLGGPTLQVAIHDHGIGIPPEEQERVFRQFYQIDGSMTRQFGGLGLGLSVAQKIIEAHGGRIWLESKVNKGTTVYFTVLKSIPGTGIDATAPLVALN